MREREARRVYRYAIKRLSVGVASVAVSASLLFVSNGVVAQAAMSPQNSPAAMRASDNVTELP
ncbi:YSIRK-type signal peptide-containing protein [Aerococcus vaginalis]